MKKLFFYSNRYVIVCVGLFSTIGRGEIRI